MDVAIFKGGFLANLASNATCHRLMRRVSHDQRAAAFGDGAPGGLGTISLSFLSSRFHWVDDESRWMSMKGTDGRERSCVYAFHTTFYLRVILPRPGVISTFTDKSCYRAAEVPPSYIALRHFLRYENSGKFGTEGSFDREKYLSSLTLFLRSLKNILVWLSFLRTLKSCIFWVFIDSDILCFIFGTSEELCFVF